MKKGLSEYIEWEDRIFIPAIRFRNNKTFKQGNTHIAWTFKGVHNIDIIFSEYSIKSYNTEEYEECMIRQYKKALKAFTHCKHCQNIIKKLWNERKKKRQPEQLELGF